MGLACVNGNRIELDGSPGSRTFYCTLLNGRGREEFKERRKYWRHHLSITHNQNTLWHPWPRDYRSIIAYRQVIGFAAFRVLRRYSAVKSVEVSCSFGSGCLVGARTPSSGQVRRVIIIRCQPVDKQNTVSQCIST